MEIPYDGNAIQPSIWQGDDGYLRMVARTATDYDEKGRRADQVKFKKQTLMELRHLGHMLLMVFLDLVLIKILTVYLLCTTIKAYRLLRH